MALKKGKIKKCKHYTVDITNARACFFDWDYNLMHKKPIDAKCRGNMQKCYNVPKIFRHIHEQDEELRQEHIRVGKIYQIAGMKLEEIARKYDK